MANTRKEKPDWFLLIDKIKAVIKVEMGTTAELAEYVGVAKARPFEWLGRKIEPKAQKVLQIQKWVMVKQGEIDQVPSIQAAYTKAMKHMGKS